MWTIFIAIFVIQGVIIEIQKLLFKIVILTMLLRFIVIL